MPQTRYDEPVSDDDVNSYAPPPSLRHNSLEGEGTAVAVHWVLCIFVLVRFAYLLLYDLITLCFAFTLCFFVLYK